MNDLVVAEKIAQVAEIEGARTRQCLLADYETFTAWRWTSSSLGSDKSRGRAGSVRPR